ncbi:MAG: hypothetical protein ABJB69_04360 [Spartobacteria bacterium]
MLQVQNAVLILGALFLLFVTFYVGKKFEYWKYQIATRNKPKLDTTEANRFGDASVEELVATGLVQENLGNWQDAADRFIAAKHKNLEYPDLLFRTAKLYYDHGRFDVADGLFERAIAFRENVDTANYYRGMIATGRRDYPAGERFYEAAANAAPFNADYFYSWAEALRRDHRLKDAVTRYGDAAMRAGEAEQNLCRFKMRMTMLEAGETAQVSLDLGEQRKLGPLSVDWLLTDAALQIQAGRIEDAARLAEEARASDRSLLRGNFAACVGDKFFSEVANNYPQLEAALRLQATPSPP